MAIRQVMQNRTTDGRPYVPLFVWVRQLPWPEQQEFRLAETRQRDLRQQAIQRGDMCIDPMQNYVWRDQETYLQDKPTDPVWLTYYQRWRSECAISDMCLIENEEPS